MYLGVSGVYLGVSEVYLGVSEVYIRVCHRREDQLKLMAHHFFGRF